MTDKEAPHCQAAFINVIREEGTHKEACDWLQKTWNERCALSSALTAAQAENVRLREELSLIAVMGYSIDPAVNEDIAGMAVDAARAALQEGQKDE